MNPDFQDILAEFLRAGVEFLVVGAHALAVHGVPRATGDLDLWIRADVENADRTWNALVAFGAPVETMRVTREDLRRSDTVVQIGLPPSRIDVLTSITGAEFQEAWESRILQKMGAIEVPFLDRETLIRNKRATGRLRDLADVEALGEEPG